MFEVQSLRLAVAWVTALTVLRLMTSAVSGLELHGDEAQYWTWAQTLDFGYFTKPPLIAWVIAATTAVCGDGEACVRAASPLLHAGTAMALYGLALAVANARVALWAAVIWITLPSVALSSMIVSTDVPLLFCWALAALALRRTLDTGRWGWVVVSGLAIGFGLLAKYAMACVLVGLALHFLLCRRDRWILRSPKGLAMIVLAGAVLTPNLAWNAANDFATVAHLGDNTNLAAAAADERFRLSEALTFLGEQAGVFGPIPVLILIWRLIAWVRGRASDPERYLMALALPPLVIITTQAFLSRANANWAATAYPTATILVALWLVEQAPRWMRYVTVVPHLLASLAMIVVIASWPDWRVAALDRPLSRLTGWNQMAQQLRPIVLTHPDLPLLMSDRKTMASLLYYLRDQIGPVEGDPDRRPVYMWDWNKRAEHHYELANAFDPARSDPALLVTNWSDPSSIVDRFAVAEPVRVISVTAFGRSKRLEVWRVAGYQGH